MRTITDTCEIFGSERSCGCMMGGCMCGNSDAVV